MTATRSVDALSTTPHALFKALLRSDAATALRVLEAKAGRQRDPRLVFPGDSNFTVLHAAALGSCAAAIPALVAAGAPLDAELRVQSVCRTSRCASCWRPAATRWTIGTVHRPWTWLQGAPSPSPTCCCPGLAVMLPAATLTARARSHACRSRHASCVQQLLEQGASTGVHDAALRVAASMDHADAAACQQLLLPFLQHGVDPLAPVYGPSSLLTMCSSTAAAVLLAHLEQEHLRQRQLTCTQQSTACRQRACQRCWRVARQT